MKLLSIVLTILLLSSVLLRKIKKNKNKLTSTNSNSKSTSKTKVTPGETAYTRITQNIAGAAAGVLSSCGLTAGWTMRLVTGVDDVKLMDRANLEKFSLCSLLSCKGSKVPKTPAEIVTEITTRLAGNQAVLIDVVKEHWFVVFRKDATHTYLIQSFQGYYTLNQWLTHMGQAGILTTTFTHNFEIFIDQTKTQAQRFEAAKNLFVPQGLISSTLSDLNRQNIVNEWFKNSMRLNGIVSAVLV